jgi:ABC-type multidrug transport system fused ATPase/permease subunit
MLSVQGHWFLLYTFAKGQAAYSKAATIAQESISHIRTVTAFSAHAHQLSLYTSALSQAYYQTLLTALCKAFGIALLFLLFFSTYALAFWYGAKLVGERRMNTSQVLNVLFAMVMGAASAAFVVPVLGVCAKATAAASGVFEVIERPSEIPTDSEDGIKVDRVDADISFHSVSFSYPSRPGVPVLRDVSLTLPYGKTVAVVGPSGSGKSTLIHLLTRAYNPTSGHISLGPIPLHELNVRAWRQCLGVVGQELFMFNTSVRRNVAFGYKQVQLNKDLEVEKKEAEIKRACQDAYAHSFITHFSQGD